MIINIRKLVITIVLAFIYGTCNVFGYDIMTKDTIEYGNIYVWLRIVGWTAVFIVIIYAVEYAIDIYFSRHSFINATIRTGSNIFYFVVLGIILICWLPIYATCYPGLGIYDGPCQLMEMTTHHPVLHTLYIWACRDIASVLDLSSWLVPYAFIQMIILAASYAYLINCMRRWNWSLIYVCISLVWICLFPMNALMSLASTKDTLFTAFFILILCEVGKSQHKKEYWMSANCCVRFALLSFLVCAFRNNGVFAFIGIIVLLIIVRRTAWRRILLIGVGVTILFTLYSGPLMRALDIPQGNKREAMSVLIQPLARVYHERKYQLSETEKTQIETLFGGEPWYVSHISDAPKSQFQTDEFLNQIQVYTKLFVKLGVCYPDVYLDAWLATTYGNWYPHEILPDQTAYRFYFEFPEISAEEYGTLYPRLYNFLQTISRGSSYLKIPFMYVIFCTGSVLWLELFLLACVIIHREYYKIAYFIPTIVLFATIMLGPVALFRYTYPLMVGNIWLIGMVLDNRAVQGDEKVEYAK